MLLLISSKAVTADQHIKNPSKLKTGLEGRMLPIFCSGVTIQPTRKLRFFYSVGLSCLWYIKVEPTNCDFISQVHRLCVLASGTSAFVIFSCFAFINVCLWHLGQNSGKFFSSVSSRICTLVLLPQTGHSIHSIFVFFTSILKVASCLKSEYLQQRILYTRKQ